MSRLAQPVALLALLCSLGPVLALESVDHPNPSALSGGTSDAIRSAQAVFQAAQGQTGASGSDWGALGMVYHAHEMTVPAGQAYRNAAELEPRSARWPHLLGILAQQQGEFRAAIDHFDTAIVLDSDYLASQFQKGRALLDAGDTEDAEAIFDSLARQHDMAAAHAELGQLLLSRSAYGPAAEHLQRALNLQPGASRLNHPLALAYRGLGDAERARQALAAAGDQGPRVSDSVRDAMLASSGSAGFYLSQGLSAARSKDYPAALALMQRAMEADPRRATVRINYARMLEANRRVDEAITVLQSLLTDDPDNGLAEYNLGAIHEVAGDDAQALYHYRRAVARAPDLFQARQLLANALMRSGEFAEAAQNYRAGLVLRPERTDLMMLQGFAEYESGDCESAIGTLLSLVEQLPENFEALIAYSRVAAVCPELPQLHRENALNAARNMYRLAPAIPVTATLALAEAASGDFVAAVEYQMECLFAAERDERLDLIGFLRADFEAYQQERLPQRPWPEGHPTLNPRPLKHSDRY